MKSKSKDGLVYRLFASMWRRKWWIFLSALAVAAAVAFFGAASSQKQATNYIKLDFESAHDGLTPSGTRFNIYDLKSESLLTKAIELTGLQGKITWREMADALTVAPSRTQSVSKRYIATEYTAVLTWQKAFGRVSARSMLDVICRLYYQDFLRQNAVNHAHLDVDWAVLEEMEYAEIGNYLKSRTDILRQFLQSRIDGSGGYESQDAVLSFRALLTTVENFQSVSVSKFAAFIAQSRLFKDVASYQSKLTYQRLLIDQNYQLSRAQFSVREQALRDYQESLIAIVMVPTYYQGNGLYMSRTQTGIDTLTKEAEGYSAIGQKQALKLAQIDESIASLALARQAAADQADAMLQEMTGQFDALLQSVKNADDAYIAYTARDYISFDKKQTGLTSAYHVKEALAAACVWALALSLTFFWADRREKARPALPLDRERRAQT